MGIYNIRTDIASEIQEELGLGVPGISSETKGYPDDISVTHVHIFSEDGARKIGKPMGHYVTVDIPRDHRDLFEASAKALAQELKALADFDNKTVLVAGLGNRHVTPDALGPKVLDRLMITRHIHKFLPEQLDNRTNSVCAVSPGVLGMTGIETGEIIKGIVKNIKPDVIICIDALASRSSLRVGNTFQVTDTGINPGSGIGNKRMAITEKTMGVPVIAIGVPLVVYAATIAYDAIAPLLSSEHGMDEQRITDMIHSVLPEQLGDFVVTPKEIDSLVDTVSKTISAALNMSLHPGLGLDEVLTLNPNK